MIAGKEDLMYGAMEEYLKGELARIAHEGLYKEERILTSPQGSMVRVRDGRQVLNMCANNYLGLSGHPELIAAAREGLATWGHGLSSVRFICGTQSYTAPVSTQMAVCSRYS
jgi:glycine C-acetyltransferase